MVNQTSQAASLVKLQIDDSKVFIHDDKKNDKNDKLIDFPKQVVDENNAYRMQQQPLEGIRGIKDAAQITSTGFDHEGSSHAPNLNNEAFKAIQEEAECEYDCINESSDLNRVVSEILKNRKCDPNDAMSKKRRQRLTYE